MSDTRLFPSDLTPACTAFCGQTLGATEPAAAGALRLSEPQRLALWLALDGDRLDYRRRQGWQHPAGSTRIQDATVQALVRADLMIVVRRSRFRKHARLTAHGAWYARTIATDAISILHHSEGA
jgi:hypothetical protein